MRLLTICEAARRLNVSVAEAREMRYRGDLRPAVAMPAGNRRHELFDAADVERALLDMYPHRTYEFAGETVTVVYDDMPRLS